MEYRHVVAVTGLSGLFVLVSTKNDGAIVRSLADGSIKFIASRLHQITPLESIEIYTTEDKNVRLHEVFEKIKENDTEVLALNRKKDDKAARALFATFLPTFDSDRVYTSDIKKVYKWYEVLKGADMLDFESFKKVLEEQTVQADIVMEKPQEATEETVEEAPKKKAAAKKSKKVAAEESDETTATAKEPAKKKTATKKTTKKKDA